MVDPSGDATLPAPDPTSSPATLPVVDRAHYDVLSEHARGGLGRILRARDRRTGRLVAIKEMLRDAPEATSRFFREAMITANLQHPAIVPVYELGQWPDGEPFYAMKLVDGRALDAAMRDARTLDERLAMLPRLLDVADALAYAHGEGVIHRDLKPANVLVGAFGETVVIDWGLARRKGDVEAEGAVMGTPAYMPPEQARGDEADARADVYAIGAMLYHLLGGQVPYADATTADQILDAVRAGPPRPLAALEPGVPADLVAVVTKAMAHARDDRYASARELADDLRRFQTGQLVGAHAYSTWQLARRLLRRHRAAFAVAAVLVAALAVTVTIAFRKITAERNVAQAERAEADRQRGLVEARNRRLIVTQARGALLSDPTLALAWLQQLPAGAPEWADARMIAADARERGVARWVFRGHAGNVNDVVFTADDRMLISAGEDATIRVWDLTTGEVRVVKDLEPVESILLTPDGTQFVSVGPFLSDAETGRRIVVWDVATLTPRVVPPPAGERDTDLELAPDGGSLALIDCNGGVRIVELSGLTARPLRAATQTHNELCTNAMAFSPDGRTLAAETVASDVELLDVADGASRLTFAPGGRSVRQLEFTPDGTRLLVLTFADLASWGVARGDRQVIVPNRGAVRAFATNRDGTRLILGGGDHTIRTWNLADGAYEVIASHAAPLTALVLAPDQHHVVSAGRDGTLQVTDLDGKSARALRGHGRAITSTAVSHDSQWIASSSDDGTIRVWSTDGARRSWAGTAGGTASLTLAPDERSIVVSDYDGAVERWTLDGVRTVVRAALIEPGTGLHPTATVLSGDGRVIAAGRVQRDLDVWSAPGAAPRTIETPDIVAGLAISDDGATIAWVTQMGIVQLDHAGTRTLATPGLDDVRRRGIAMSPDAGVVVWAAAGRGLGVYDAARDLTRTIAGISDGEVRALILPDPSTAYSLTDTGDVIRWDLAHDTATLVFRQAIDPDYRGRIELSPDHATLASADVTHEIRLTDLATGQSRTWAGHSDQIDDLAFSPDGRELASAADDTTVQLWDLATGESRMIPHHEPVYFAQLTHDGRLVTVTKYGTIGVILDDVPRDEAGLRAFLAAATNLVVDPEAR